MEMHGTSGECSSIRTLVYLAAEKMEMHGTSGECSSIRTLVYLAAEKRLAGAPRGAGKCRERLAGKHDGLVLLAWLATEREACLYSSYLSIITAKKAVC